MSYFRIFLCFCIFYFITHNWTPCWGVIDFISATPTGSVPDLSAANSIIEVGEITITFSAPSQTVILEDTGSNPGMFIRSDADSPQIGDLAPFTVTITESGPELPVTATSSQLPVNCNLGTGSCSWTHTLVGAPINRTYHYTISTNRNTKLFRGTYTHTTTITLSDL